MHPLLILKMSVDWTRGLPESRVGSRSKAPVSPVSSSTVNRHSSGGSGCSELGGRSRSASAAATPMPLSAPSVVPSAWIACHRGH